MLKKEDIKEIDAAKAEIMVQFAILDSGTIGVISDPNIFTDVDLHSTIFAAITEFLHVMIRDATPEIRDILRKRVDTRLATAPVTVH